MLTEMIRLVSFCTMLGW